MDAERLSRMQAEWAELEDRSDKLDAFINSPDFDRLDEIEQGLLIAQMGGMTAYSCALGLRLKLSRRG